MNDTSFTLTSRSVFGILILLLGIVLTLGNFEIIDSPSVIRYWPALLVVFGLVKVMQPGGNGGRVFGGIIAFVGAGMLLNRLDILDFNFWNLWPLLLVGAGASFIFRSRPQKHSSAEDGDVDVVSGTVILSGMEQNNASQQFHGGEVSAILGGHTIDLRDADMPDGSTATLDLFAFMGGVEIRVPTRWTVVIEGSAFMGGFENKARSAGAGNKKLIVKGLAIMGGVELSN